MKTGPISKAVHRAYEHALQRLHKHKQKYGSSTMTDEKGDMTKVVKHLKKALEVLSIEKYYY